MIQYPPKRKATLCHDSCTNLTQTHAMAPAGTGEDELLGNSVYDLFLVNNKGAAVKV